MSWLLSADPASIEVGRFGRNVEIRIADVSVVTAVAGGSRRQEPRHRIALALIAMALNR
jgi:hypothetical protein